VKKYELVDDELIARFKESAAERESYLLLEPHLELEGFWKVNSFDPDYHFSMRDVMGNYYAVSPADLEDFLRAAESMEYKVAFFDDPTAIMNAYEALNDDPPFKLNSSFEGTIDGFLPFQLQGFNFMKDLPGALAMWSTGTGKTVLANALCKYHLDIVKNVDQIWYVAKSNNKVNAQRSLERIVGLDSFVIDPNPTKELSARARRAEIYEEIGKGNTAPIAITNFERFRDDFDIMSPLFEGRRVFVVWDEMPKKLINRTSELYKSVALTLYSSIQIASARRNPESLIQVMTSATPIESNPENFFNCVRLIDPSLYGTVRQFRDEYVARYDNRFGNPHDPKPVDWHKLDKMGMQAMPIMHQVDKEDPDIAQYFPEMLTQLVYVDWNKPLRKVYDMLTADAEEYGLDEINPLALMTVMQMFCDAPTLVQDSAAVYAAWEELVAGWDEDVDGKKPDQKGSAAAIELVERLEGSKLSNDNHTKLLQLKEILTEKHPDQKVCVFASLLTGLIIDGEHPAILPSYFDEWGVPYVVYAGTDKQKQRAEDSFRNDPDIQVFLSSDMGSDSLDLPEGEVVVDYDIPIKWTTLIQRRNRINRASSEHEMNHNYSLLMVDSVDERKLEIVEKKKGYHDAAFKGEMASGAMSARMSRADLLYILTGSK